MEQTQQQIEQFINIDSKSIVCNKNDHQDYFLSAIVYENDTLQALCSQCINESERKQTIYPLNKFCRVITQHHTHYLESYVQEIEIVIKEFQEIQQQIKKKIQVETAEFNNKTIPKIIKQNTCEGLNQNLKEISNQLQKWQITLEEINVIPKQLSNIQIYKDSSKIIQNIKNFIIDQESPKKRYIFDPEFKYEQIDLSNQNLVASTNDSKWCGVLMNQPISQNQVDYIAFQVQEQIVNGVFLGICHKDVFKLSGFQNIFKQNKSVALNYGGYIWAQHQIQDQVDIYLPYEKDDILIIKADLQNNTIGFRNLTKGKSFLFKEKKFVVNEQNMYFYAELTQTSLSIIPMKSEYHF